jgi:translation initiation factor eIF-2B subunit epsilon
MSKQSKGNQKEGNKKKEKSGSGGGGGGGADDELKREQKLQAILLADSFQKSFRPITWEQPKVLLPLVNVPMLEYTVEFLAQNGVEEIFIFCVWHAEMLQSYINNSKWPSNIAVKCISSSACLSAGDALRELDALGVIRSDPFILISGDVICNMDLKKAIAYHKEKRKKDSNAIMTVVLKEVQKTAGVKPVLDDLVIGLNRTTSQLILFEDSASKKSFDIPLEIMMDHPGVTFLPDMLDCHVDICSPELMLQFSDNFDYQDIRRDFIQNEVCNWELGMHIYGYIIKDEYAARVQDPRTYHYICRDIVTRWVHPIVPDAQILQDSTFVHLKRYVYKEQGVKVARSAVIGEGVVLGRGCVIEDDVVLEKCIVGRDCFIGRGAVVTESHIWQGARIGSGATVKQAIICDNAEVKSKAKVGRGCILSYNTVVGEGIVLPDYTRISCQKRLEDEKQDKQQELHGYDSEIVGVDGKGYLWTYYGSGDYSLDDDDDDDDEDEKVAVDVLKSHSIGSKEEEVWKRFLWKKMPLPIEPEDEDDDDDDYDDDNTGNQVDLTFNRNVGDMIVTGKAQGHSSENILMEIKGYKFAQNKSFSQCLRAVLPPILDMIATVAKNSTRNQILSTMKDLIKVDGWGYIIMKAFIYDRKDELTLIESIEDYVLLENGSSLYPFFRFLLQMVYDAELVNEETLKKWIEIRSDSDDEDDPKIKLFEQPEVQEFVDWIQDDDDDDDDDDEDDDDEDDEDD